MKGGGKGGPKGGAAKGNSKGFKGECWTCGKTGHRSSECRSGQQVSYVNAEEGAAEEEAPREIGGVNKVWSWSKEINHVHRIQPKPVGISNRYEGLPVSDCCQQCGEDAPPGLESYPSNFSLACQPQKRARMPAVQVRKSWKPAKLGIEKAIGHVGREYNDPHQDERQPTQQKMKTSQIGNVNKNQKHTPALCQMMFHLTDANKMLASVDRMTEVGNRVEFNRKLSFIESPNGRRAHMRRKNGVYVLDVVFIRGDKAVKGEIVVDSGAADNVMPANVLEEFEKLEPQAGVRFVGADGEGLGNYGRRQVQFVPLELWKEEFGSPFQGQA